MKEKESFCSCCGVPNWKYNTQGHDYECIWYEDEMYRLAVEWLNGPEYEEHPFKKHMQEDGSLKPMVWQADWKKRYDLIVKFLTEQIKDLKKIIDEK